MKRPEQPIETRSDMDWILDNLNGFLAGHGRQLLIAAALSILGTLSLLLVSRLGRRSKSRPGPEPDGEAISMPRQEVESLYRQEETCPIVDAESLGAEPERAARALCPPELSRRIDSLQNRIRNLAGGLPA